MLYKPIIGSYRFGLAALMTEVLVSVPDTEFCTALHNSLRAALRGNARLR